ncbi:hypothetical protein PVAP13_5NG104244 [Panicum virgatum]|uniref:RING-CH-type domain-containing protein n=1 Tax=Panicum virgatum TaxID=38727 RepID=A0A8T0RWX1_PANVG|nr:hypothetical protein PVAP13_5NG104244 [Panicum virgatum]
MHPPPPPAPAPIDRGMPAAAADGALPEATGKDDVEASPAACCRICLQPDCARGDELISPCRCKGTQQFVHRTCLDHWRAVKEGTAFSHCTTCEAQFYLRVIGTIAGVTYLLDRDGKFRNRCGGALCTDRTLWAAATLLLRQHRPIMPGRLLLRMRGMPRGLGGGLLPPSCYRRRRRRLRHPWVIYGCIAATLAFQNSMQRHYHILNK